MDIQTSAQGDVTVVTVSGSLDGSTVQEAQDQILPKTASASGVVLDLKNCGYISSAGLRMLLLIAKQVAVQKGVVALSGVSDEIKDVMEMTGFGNFFKSYPNVAAAVKALGKGA